MQALFLDNAYGVDSGGDPTVIPNLTFQQFQVFFCFFVGGQANKLLLEQH